VAPWDSPGAMVPAMFSTSVLERRKSLDPEMVRQLEVSEGIFVDKENRPPKAGNGAIKEAVKVKVGDGYGLGGWFVQFFFRTFRAIFMGILLRLLCVPHFQNTFDLESGVVAGSRVVGISFRVEKSSRG